MDAGARPNLDDQAPPQGCAGAWSCPVPGNRWLLATLGLLSVGLGVLGIFLPLLPTTPFLLLAAACFARSSPRLDHWLHRNRLFGNYLRAYREGQGIPRRARITALAMLWATLLASAVLVPKWPVWLLLGAIGAGVSLHILRLGRAS